MKMGREMNVRAMPSLKRINAIHGEAAKIIAAIIVGNVGFLGTYIAGSMIDPGAKSIISRKPIAPIFPRKYILATLNHPGYYLMYVSKDQFNHASS